MYKSERYFSDMSVAEYQRVRAHEYMNEVKKPMRDFIVKDDFEEYGKRELKFVDRMMWGDIPNIT